MEKMTDEQKRLAEDNIELVYHIINDLKYILYPDYEDCETRYIDFSHNTVGDFLGAGYVGLCKASMTFDKTLGYAFSTYAYKSIKRHILREYNANKIGAIISNNELILSLDANITEDMCILDTLVGDSCEYTNSELWITIKDAINKSGIRDKEKMMKIIILYAHGYTYEEIGEIYDVSRQAIDQKIKSIRRLMQ